MSHNLINDDSRVSESRDPRLFTAWSADDTTVANLCNTPSLAGQVLKRESTDSGWQVVVFDAAGRPVWMTDGRGTVQSLSYDELGRQVSGSEQLSGGAVRVSWRGEYGDAGPENDGSQDNNLRGMCVAQYDDGGLQVVNSVALSGTVLSGSQQFLTSAEAQPDWPEADSDRQALLEATKYTTIALSDALGAPLVQTDAMGHQLAWQYDVSGRICSQAVTPAGGSKQTAHMAPIETVSENNSVILSFREAGKYTIEALQRDAAAKGHNILEKTIKPSSLSSAYGERANEMEEKAKSAGLIGMVGHWVDIGNGTKEIKGIWVHDTLTHELPEIMTCMI